jgi:hypothetical protein
VLNILVGVELTLQQYKKNADIEQSKTQLKFKKIWDHDIQLIQDIKDVHEIPCPKYRFIVSSWFYSLLGLTFPTKKLRKKLSITICPLMLWNCR